MSSMNMAATAGTRPRSACPPRPSPAGTPCVPVDLDAEDVRPRRDVADGEVLAIERVGVVLVAVGLGEGERRLRAAPASRGRRSAPAAPAARRRRSTCPATMPVPGQRLDPELGIGGVGREALQRVHDRPARRSAGAACTSRCRWSLVARPVLPTRAITLPGARPAARPSPRAPSCGSRREKIRSGPPSAGTVVSCRIGTVSAPCSAGPA